MLRNFLIRSKLIIALLGAAGAGRPRPGRHPPEPGESDRAERSTAFARLAAGLAPLIHQLQAERLSADEGVLEEKIEYGLSELSRIGEQRKTIDTATIVASELAVKPGIELHEEEGEEELQDATEAGHGPLVTPGAALKQYTDTVSDLLDINGEITPRSNNERLLKGVAASVALSRAKDFADNQGSLLQNVYAADHFEGDEHAKLSALVAAEVIYTAQFDANATEAEHEFREDTVAGPQVERVDEFVQRALKRESATAPKLGINPAFWFGAMSVKLDRLRTLRSASAPT